MTWNEIYDILELISKKNINSEEDLDFLFEQIHNEDPEIRAYVAELLVRFNTEKVQDELMMLCDDDDELVRINACDSLSVFYDIDVYKRLWNCFLTDSSELVKNYSLLSIIDIMSFLDIDKKILKESFMDYLHHYDGIIKVSLLKGLYLLGVEDCLDELLDMLCKECYEIQYNIIRTLYDIINFDNREKILFTISAIKKKEANIHILSEFEKLEEHLLDR